MGTLLPIPARIDTCGIAFPIAAFDAYGKGVKHTVSDEGEPSESHKWTRHLDGGGFLATGVGESAWVEASLPKRATHDDVDGPRNDEALGVADALEVLRDLWGEALNHVECRGEVFFDDCRVVRLDLVRDFHNVTDPTPVLDGLAAVDQPGRAKVRRFADAAANRAETLRVGPRAWGCTLYDKHVESNGRAPAGQLRYEARLHGDQLTSAFAQRNGGKFGTVADLVRSGGASHTLERYWMGGSARGYSRTVYRDSDDGNALARAQRAWFDRVGFGLTVSGRHELVARLGAAGLRNSEACGLWAYLTLPGAAGSMHRNTRRKYRRLATRLGIAPAFFGPDDQPMMTIPTHTTAVRLDYETGVLVAA